MSVLEFNDFMDDNFIEEIKKYIDGNENDYRTNKSRYREYVYEKDELTDRIFDMIKDIVPTYEKNGIVYKLNDYSERVSIAKNYPGSVVYMHKDAIFDEKENLTKFLIYLTEFEGGETNYYTDNDELFYTTKPQKGAGVLFDMDLKHDANKVLGDNIKYTIGIRLYYCL